MPGTAGPRFGDGVAMAAAAAVGRPGLPVPARRLHAAAAGPTTPSAIPIVSKPIVILGGVELGSIGYLAAQYHVLRQEC